LTTLLVVIKVRCRRAETGKNTTNFINLMLQLLPFKKFISSDNFKDRIRCIKYEHLIKSQEYLLQDLSNSLLLDNVFIFLKLQATQQMYNPASKHTPNVNNSNSSPSPPR